jgi:hypothetical protein
MRFLRSSGARPRFRSSLTEGKPAIARSTRWYAPSLPWLPDLLLFKSPGPDMGWDREFEGGSVIARVCFGSTGGLDGAAEAAFGSCKEGDHDGNKETGRSEGGEAVGGLARGWTEIVRFRGSSWGPVAILSLDEEEGAREGSAFRDGGEFVAGCTGSCIEPADTVVPEFVIPLRCAARVFFEENMPNDLVEDLDLIDEEACCALSASRGGCDGGPLMRITSGSMTPIWGCSPCQTVHRAQRQTAPLWLDETWRLPLNEQLFDCLCDGVSSVAQPRG